MQYVLIIACWTYVIWGQLTELPFEPWMTALYYVAVAMCVMHSLLLLFVVFIFVVALCVGGTVTYKGRRLN